MSLFHKIEIHLSPVAVVLLTVFLLLGNGLLLAALLLAALCHELSHIAVLRLLKTRIKGINFTVFGVEMQVPDTIGYGGEWLATAAGPVVNLLLAVLMALEGTKCQNWYLFSGAQAVLGLFNLLPIRPLDGGNLLWIAIAFFTEPYTADAMCRWVGFLCALLLSALCLWLFIIGGGGFPLLAAVGLLWQTAGEIGLVKWRRRG